MKFTTNAVVNIYLAFPDNDPSIIVPPEFEVIYLSSTNMKNFLS